MKPDNSLPDRCLRFPEVQQLVPYTKMHIDRLEKAGQFPARIHFGPGRIAWKLSEIMAWVEAKRAAPAPTVNRPAPSRGRRDQQQAA